MSPKVNQAADYLKSVRDVAQLILAGDKFDFKVMNPAVESTASLDGVFSYLPKIAQSRSAASEVLGKSSPEFIKASESLVKMVNALKNNWPAAPSDVREAAQSVQENSKNAWGKVLAEKAKSISATKSSSQADVGISPAIVMNDAPRPK